MKTLSLLFSLLVLSLSSLAAQDPQAQTAGDPRVEVLELRHQLRPLTQEQIKVEVAAWQNLVQAKISEMSAKEIEALNTEDAAAREKILNDAAGLRDQASGLFERFELVLEAFESKGGKPEAERAYLSTVRSPLIDVEDAHAIWVNARSWVTSKEGGQRLAWDIGKALLVLLAFRLLARLAGGIVRKALKPFKKISDLLRDFLVKTTSKIIFFIGILIALDIMGVPMGPFLAAMGAAGFIIGFALQGTLSNFASGVMLLLYRPYDVGDGVQVAGVSGKVEAMTMVSTTLLTFDNQLVVVPNNSIWGGVITNVTGMPTRRVDMVFGIGYGDDIDKALKILHDVVSKHEKVLKDPEPTIKCNELADSSVNFVVRPWSKTSDYWAVKWDITKQVKQRFDAEGVSIPFPQRDVHVHQVADAT